ncbi:unnamed protein product [Durusdinium trenchii]|uniref:Molybdenum cofactor sulfurase n=1 Tax=Durusdinium trenchii TaxID=1381693 RepID=A0ABP0I848_9DINO
MVHTTHAFSFKVCFHLLWRSRSLLAVACRSGDGHRYLQHIEDFRKDQLSHLGEVVYLDYAGAALFSRAQLAELLLTSSLGNPHSSRASEELLDRSRDLVLHMFRTTRATHSVVFTSGATQSLELLGEHYPWTVNGGCFLYADESHTSVLGLRQFARRSNWAFGTFALEDLPNLANDLSAAKMIEGQVPESIAGCNLLAFPGESNFSGLRTDLSCLSALRQGPQRWRLLLDAAKLACSPGSLDLSQCPADFTVISFYKIFGYPTGLGALLLRHDAAPCLFPRDAHGPSGPSGPLYFAGGCVSSVSATSSFVVPRPSLSQWMERGTPHFQGIFTLSVQLATVRRLGTDLARSRHALAVCHEAFLRTARLRHSNGQRLCRIFGAHEEIRWAELQGPTLALELHYADSSPVPYGLVAERAAARKIMLRTGCHCNDEDIRHFHASGKVCGDDRGLIEGRSTGIVRVSFGLYSTMEDVSRWIELLVEFQDLLPTEPKILAENLAATNHLTNPTVKGCGPLRVNRWPLDPSGSLFLDRRWCLSLGTRRSKLRPVSAKQAPRLTTVRISLRDLAPSFVLLLSSKFHPETLEIALSEEDSKILQANGVAADPLDTTRNGARMHEDASNADASIWFEQLLDLKDLQLRCSSDGTAGTGEAPARTDFANAPKTLLTLGMVSTASLRRFGELCGLEVPAERFRANVEEMSWPVGLALGLTDEPHVAPGRLHFEVAGRCVRCQAVDIDPEDPERSSGVSLLAALATSQVSSESSKGPTFGVLLRKRGHWQERPMLEVGMSLEAEDGALAKDRHLIWEKLFSLEDGEEAAEFCKAKLRGGLEGQRPFSGKAHRLEEAQCLTLAPEVQLTEMLNDAFKGRIYRWTFSAHAVKETKTDTASYTKGKDAGEKRKQQIERVRDVPGKWFFWMAAISRFQELSLCPAELAHHGLSFDSKFEIDEGNVLGTGKFSTVYMCFRRGQPNRRFALKAISTYTGDDASMNRILEEINIMKVIEYHQSIIRLVDMDQSTSNTIRLVLELCEGGELYDRIQQKRYYSESDTKLLVKNLLEAVCFIHSKGIMHRDLKPESCSGRSATLTSRSRILGSRSCQRTGLENSHGRPPFVVPTSIWLRR